MTLDKEPSPGIMDNSKIPMTTAAALVENWQRSKRFCCSPELLEKSEQAITEIMRRAPSQCQLTYAHEDSLELKVEYQWNGLTTTHQVRLRPTLLGFKVTVTGPDCPQFRKNRIQMQYRRFLAEQCTE